MKRFIARYVPWSREQYAVLDTYDEDFLITDPMPYHEANDEADQRNAGTWGQPQAQTDVPIYGWLSALNLPTQP